MPKPKLVLAVSGGGSRAIIPATLLDRMRVDLGRTMHDFDLVVGTSAGAILTLYGATANPQPLLSLFDVSTLETMCDKSLFDRVMGEVQLSPVYNGLGKTSVLNRYFAETTLDQLGPQKVAVPIYNLYQKQTEIFANYRPGQGSCKVAEVCDAATAAVPYFPPVTLKDDLYVDGGFAANDPLLLAYTEARALFGADCPIRLLGLGTGRQIPNQVWMREPVKQWGAIQWVQNGLVELLMSAPMDLTVDNLHRIMQLDNEHNRLLWINENVPLDIKLDNTCEKDLESLRAQAENTYRAHRSDLEQFFEAGHDCAVFRYGRK